MATVTLSLNSFIRTSDDPAEVLAVMSKSTGGIRNVLLRATSPNAVPQAARESYDAAMNIPAPSQPVVAEDATDEQKAGAEASYQAAVASFNEARVAAAASFAAVVEKLAIDQATLEDSPPADAASVE
jgi:hypothetical protein